MFFFFSLIHLLMEQIKQKKRPFVNLWEGLVWVICENIVSNISCCAGTEGSFHLMLTLKLSVSNRESFFFLQSSVLILVLCTLDRQENLKLKEQVSGGGQAALIEQPSPKQEPVKEEAAKTKVEMTMTQQVCAFFFHEPLYLRWHHHRIPGAVLNLCWFFF